MVIPTKATLNLVKHMVKDNTYGDQMEKNMKENGLRDIDMAMVSGRIRKVMFMKVNGSLEKLKEKVHSNGTLEIFTWATGITFKKKDMG